jgi:hypothetical protein
MKPFQGFQTVPLVLSTREDGPEVRFGKDASDFFAFVPLNFNLAILDRAANSASLLHRPRQLLFLRQTDADESFDDGNSLAAASGFLSDDIDATTGLSWRCFAKFLPGLRRRHFRARRQMVARQISKRIMTKLFGHTCSSERTMPLRE